jgi:hypothetical protein
MKNSYKIFVEKPAGKKVLENLNRRCKGAKNLEYPNKPAALSLL